jgi:hypothetical protein
VTATVPALEKEIARHGVAPAISRLRHILKGRTSRRPGDMKSLAAYETPEVPAPGIT